MAVTITLKGESSAVLAERLRALADALEPGYLYENFVGDWRGVIIYNQNMEEVGSFLDGDKFSVILDVLDSNYTQLSCN